MNDATDRDVLLAVIERRDVLKRYGIKHATTIAVLTSAADEITRLRARLEACQERHRVLERI